MGNSTDSNALYLVAFDLALPTRLAAVACSIPGDLLLLCSPRCRCHHCSRLRFTKEEEQQYVALRINSAVDAEATSESCEI